MNVTNIPVISVSYNSAELIEDLLSSFRTHYPNPITIIDGSSEGHFRDIEAVCAKYENVHFIHFDYNIHHGPGMAWAFQNLPLSGPVLVLDSDVFILKHGFIESMAENLKPEMYGVGSVSYINEGGYDVDYEQGAIRYLHPACMLCNIEVIRQWPMPTKHGAPLTEPMLAIHRSGRHELIKGIEWVREDFAPKGEQNQTRHFIRHDWQGTVKRTGSYNLEEWDKSTREETTVRMTMLSLIPRNVERIMEFGSTNGSLARAIKMLNPNCHYTAVEIDPDNNDIEKGACDKLLHRDVEEIGDDFFRDCINIDCWILDKALESIKDPDQFLTRIRKVIKPDACIVAIIPNVQHWSIQAKLNIGDFRYENNGLLCKRNIKWFSRATIFEIFKKSGFRIQQGCPIVHAKLENEELINAITLFSKSIGADPTITINDAQANYYIILAKPV